VADALYELVVRFSSVLVIIAAGTLLEFVADAEKQNHWTRLRGIFFWAFYVAGVVIAAAITNNVAPHLGLKPLLSVDLRPLESLGGWVAIAAVLTTALIVDFLYYWFHRLQHACAPLWHFHQVHHSFEELNLANSAHHLTEEIFKIPFLVIPMALLIEIKVSEAPLLAAVLAGWGTFVHVNARISFGPLNYVLSQPRYHRVHHSMDERHHNKNFASLFPIWDIVFGTAYFPNDAEPIRTGLHDKRGPRSVREYLFALAARDAEKARK